MKEGLIQRAILEYLAYVKDIYFFRANSGSVVTSNGRFFKTGKKGCPDIIVSYKGYFIGLEVKNDKGIQSVHQKDAEIDIKKSGGQYYVVHSVDEVENIIRNIK